LNQDFYEAVIQRATTGGWFAGIRVKEAVMRQRPEAMRPEEFIVRHSIGTDFALGFARTAYSARLPVSRGAVGKVIAYLNSANEGAQQSGYVWNMYTNNCSHVAHNALAAAGVWDPKVARGPGAVNVVRDVLSVAKALALRQMSDFSFPANNFVRLYEAGNERPIDDALAAFRNHDVRRTMKDGWTSTGPGALIATYPIHDASRNEMFAPGRDPFVIFGAGALGQGGQVRNAYGARAADRDRSWRESRVLARALCEDAGKPADRRRRARLTKR
jgi:hypothetical protein